MSEPLLDVRDLTVVRASSGGLVTALDGVTLSVGRGEIVGIVGESGSGKSTLGSAVMGLLPERLTSTTGSIEFDGGPLAQSADFHRVRGRRIATVFQDSATSLNPLMRVGSQIAEMLRVRGDEAVPKVLDLLRSVHLRDPETVVRRYPHELSGGMRQRVQIAMATANDPELLIADEPTTALDATVQMEIIRLLREINRRTGMAILFISHNLAVVSEFCDRVVVMKSGRVVESGSCEQIFEQPREEYTRDLIAAIPRLEIESSLAAREPATAGAAVLTANSIYRTFRGRRGFRRTELHALVEANFTVGPGRTLGIVGESGSGKSTLARCIVGLDRPDRGSIVFEGRDITGRSARKALRGEIQMVYQDPFDSLDPKWTVTDLVGEALTGVPKAARKERAAEALRSVGLGEEQWGRRPREFSGGERQRISIARAIVAKPRMIVLDEPTSSLDASIQAEVLRLLHRIQHEQGVSYVFITHDLAVANLMCHDILVLEGGRVVEAGPAQSILFEPEHEYTRQLVGAVR